MIASGGSPTPPPTPTYVPYIRGGGDGSYIDTGIKPDNTTKVIVWARNFQPGGGNLFGSRTSSISNRFCLLTPGAANAGRIRIDYGNANDTYADDQFANLSHYHKYELYQGVLKIDDVTIAATGTQPTFSGTYNLYLFGNNNAGTLQNLNFPADICACQIYKGGTLVRDFTPVESPSVGLYDAVSETVFTNAGSGALSYGTFNSSAYTPLEYIECNGSQYFDSGVYGTENIRVVCKFRMTSTTAQFRRLFGCRNSGDTIMCELMVGTDVAANKSFDMRYSGANNSVYNVTSQTGNDLVFTATGNSFGLYKNNSALGTKTGASGSFTTPYTMYVGTSNIYGNAQMQYSFYGRICFLSLDVQHAYVPAKVGNVAGMYDTYNDVFKPSVSGTPFIAGAVL